LGALSPIAIFFDMGFPILSKQEILQKLEKVGVKKGDVVYVASFSPVLGNGPNVLDDSLDALMEMVGKEGAIIMPAFNWDYCSGAVFDPLTTPSKVGVLTEAFRKRPDVSRSITPPWCTFLVWGREAKKIISIKGTSGFGADGIPQYLFDENVRYILIGCSYNDAVIQVHWLEEKYEVPYRFWKQFRGQVLLENELVSDVSSMYARRLDIDAEIDSEPLTAQFDESDKVSVEMLGLGKLRSFLTRDYVDFMTPFFEEDKLCLLTPEAREAFGKLV
jgi:aminoglycoside 3-N-acetyltransferase